MEDRVKALIEKMEKERGFAMPWRNLLAARDPEFMELYHKIAMHVFHETSALPRKMKEIIALCLDAFTFHEPGFRAHARNAFKAGATEQEILEALEVCTLLGIHNLSVSLPALTEEADKFNKQKKAT